MNNLHRFGATILILLAAGPASWAQQGSAQQPLGPYPPLYQQEESSSKPAPPSTEITRPDNRPLSGAQELSLGSSEASQNFLQPSFRFSQIADSNAAFGNGRNGYQAVSALSGSLELHRNSLRKELVLRYTGGGVFYSENSAFNTSFHQFDISQSLSWRRWSLLLADQLTYSPESPFNGNYGGLAGLGNLGAFGGQAGLAPTFTPWQSILTTNSSRVGNTALGQVQYSLSPRSSVTFSGAYGVLRFLDADLLDFNQINLGAGYNHSFTAKDSVALSYDYARFQYGGQNQQFNTHSAQLSYARRLTGRLSLLLAAGPQIVQFDNSASSEMGVFWSGRSTLQYRRGRNDLAFSVVRTVTGGSGVLAGAKTNAVQVGGTRQLSRWWSASTNVGYARNSGLNIGQTFDSVYAGAGISRALGRTASMYFNYSLQRQISDTVCSLPGCGSNLMRHVFSVGFEWHMRPVRLD